MDRPDPQKGEVPEQEVGELLSDEEIDPDENPNAVPDPYHDTRAVHGDTGNPPQEGKD